MSTKHTPHAEESRADELLDLVENAGPMPVGETGSHQRRAWTLGRRLADARQIITLALGAVRHGDYAAAIECLERGEIGEPREHEPHGSTP